MSDNLKSMLLGQFEATLAMFKDCIEKCPPDLWQEKIAKYRFCEVAYHTLCFVDFYLAESEAAFKPNRFHPTGMDELTGEYPSRLFSRDEILEYVGYCLEKLRMALARETTESLEAKVEFRKWTFPRSGLYVYNLRHVQHHTGQLSAFLRQHGHAPDWVSDGWR